MMDLNDDIQEREGESPLVFELGQSCEPVKARDFSTCLTTARLGIVESFHYQDCKN